MKNYVILLYRDLNEVLEEGTGEDYVFSFDEAFDQIKYYSLTEI